MAEQRSYYAIIPANVRYDDELPANAKLLYGEITALCNEKGYCWATNNYFASLYNTTPNTISRWIKALKDKGYIKVQMNYREGTKEIVNRYIQICGEGINKNDDTPINKNVKDNNTYTNNTFNNTNNNNNRFIKPTVEEVKEYCLERKNNIDAENFIDYYNSNGWKVGKNPMKDWKAAIRTWERRNGGNSNAKSKGSNKRDGSEWAEYD